MLIFNIPYRHTIVTITEFVMIRHGRDTADHAMFLHLDQPLHDIFGIQTELLGNGLVRLGNQRQSRLSGLNDSSIDGIEQHQASNCRPT